MLFRNFSRLYRNAGRSVLTKNLRSLTSPVCNFIERGLFETRISKFKLEIGVSERFYNTDISQIDESKFEYVCQETLFSLCERFEDFLENNDFEGADVTFGDGILTISLGVQHGTYVINRQTPNRQIWLSSPISGPKRYDFVEIGLGYWIYKHDGISLHQLLQKEFNNIAKVPLDLSVCTYSLL